MKSKIISYISLVSVGILLVLVVSAFSIDQAIDEPQEDVISPLVQKAIDAKLAKYRQTIKKKCRKRAIEAAEIYVDSLVAEELKFQAGDTMFFPSKPMRPGLPEKIILNDSTGIKPIIN